MALAVSKGVGVGERVRGSLRMKESVFVCCFLGGGLQACTTATNKKMEA